MVIKNGVLNDLITNAYVSVCKTITKQGMPRKERAHKSKTKIQIQIILCALSLKTKLKKRLNYWKQCAATIQIENVAVIELINANSRPIQRNNANT